MKYVCEKCMHRYPFGGCLVPSNLGYMEQCKHFTEDPKPQKMTNDEYIHLLDTEHLAEWIASVAQKAISIKENNDIVMLESAIWWKEWLKQPHHSKE